MGWDTDGAPLNRESGPSASWSHRGDPSLEDTALLPTTRPRQQSYPTRRQAQRDDTSGADTVILPATKQPLPWRRIIRDAIGVFIATRIAYVAVSYFAVVFAISSVTGSSVPRIAFPYLQIWETGDVTNYVRIAVQGYRFPVQTVFFPLFPMLVHIFSLGHGGPVALAVAMVISNLGSLAALIGLGLLAAQEYGSTAAMAAIRMLISFPLAFFLVMGYADNLFLALVIFAFFLARRGNWSWVIACAFFSALLRPTGVTLILPLLWEYGRQQGWWTMLWAVARRRQTTLAWSGQRSARSRAQRLQQFILYPAGLFLAAPAGVALFALYCWQTFGDPLSFVHQQETHFLRRSTSLPSAVLYLAQTLFRNRLISFLEARNLIDLVPLLVCIAIVAVACARRELSVMYLLYMLGVFYADLAAPMIGREVPFPSVGRHMLLAVPVFLLLGKWSLNRPWLDTLIISVGFALQGVFLVAVMHGNLIIFNAID